LLGRGGTSRKQAPGSGKHTVKRGHQAHVHFPFQSATFPVACRE
jgi:hypothetical protein